MEKLNSAKEIWKQGYRINNVKILMDFCIQFKRLSFLKDKCVIPCILGTVS